MKVDVYRNLNEDCYSVKSRETDNYGKVVDHVQEIAIVDANFIVQPAGQKRARENGVKNVHAFVRGIREPLEDHEDKVSVANCAFEVKYNPFERDQFFIPENGDDVLSSPFVFLSMDEGCMVYSYNN